MYVAYMATVDFSSGTSALTNALKQVFYIHKDVVAELKGKIDSLAAENDTLRKKQDADIALCQSCEELRELTRSLQATCDRQLKDKDAVITHLEGRLEKFLGGISNEAHVECMMNLTVDENTSPDSKRLDGGMARDNPVSVDSLISEPAATTASKISGKLKLPKEGQKRRRYVEQENSPSSKRQKVSPKSTPAKAEPMESSLPDDTKQLNGSGRKGQRLTRKRSEECLKLSTLNQNKNVLVPETVNLSIRGEDNADRSRSSTHTPGRKNVTRAQSPNFLTIPETLVMEEEMSQDIVDECANDECSETVEEMEAPNSQGYAEETVCVENFPQDSERCHYRSDSMILGKPLERLGQEVKKESDLNYKITKEEVKMSSVASTIVKSETTCDTSMASPVSPGIFDELVRPLSKGDTPRSRQANNTDSGKRFISCSAKPSQEMEKFLRSKPPVDSFDKRGLLRQTTLSQSFCMNNNNNNSNNSKQKVRKSKSVRSKSEYDKEEEEETILQKVIEQSLLEVNHNNMQQKLVCSGTSPSKCTKRVESPFKVPLSPSNDIRRSPRSKNRNSHSNLTTSHIMNEGVSGSFGTGSRNKLSEQTDQNACDEDVSGASTSHSSPKVIATPSQELRKSPRLSSSPISPRCQKSPRGSRGDIAKKALFQENRKNKLSHASSNSNSCSGSKPKWIAEDDEADEDRVPDKDNDVDASRTQGLNASLDPIMRLSMYLDSEATGTVRTTTATVSNQASKKSRSPNHHHHHPHHHFPIQASPPLSQGLTPPPWPSLPQTPGDSGDMDETVAPNAVAFTLSASAMNRGCNDSDARERDTQAKGPDNPRMGVSISSGDDDDDEEDVEDVIAPSPQQPQLPGRPFNSQTLSGLTSTCQSFKFVTRVKRPGVSSRTEEKIDWDLQDNDENVDADIAKKDNSHNDGVNHEFNDDDLNDPDEEGTAGEKETVTKIQSGGKPSLRQPTQSLANTFYDSFDVVPKKSPEFPHVQVVRKKADRDKLQGFSCRQCAEYYKGMNLSEGELQHRMRACSRHKHKYKAPDTPEHFWSLSIRDTAEDQVELAKKQPAVVRLRRRRKLEKKFKSKTEQEQEEEEGK